MWACCCRPLAVQSWEIPEQGELKVACKCEHGECGYSSPFRGEMLSGTSRLVPYRLDDCYHGQRRASLAHTGHGCLSQCVTSADMIPLSEELKNSPTIAAVPKQRLGSCTSSIWSIRVCVKPRCCSCRELLCHALLYMLEWAQSAFNPQTWTLWIRVA